MIISDEKFEEFVPGWEAILDEYNLDVVTYPYPKYDSAAKQGILNQLWAEMRVILLAYFAEHGVTEEDFDETLMFRMDRTDAFKENDLRAAA